MFPEKSRKADISISASGDNTVISAPTSGYIAIDHINILPTTGVTVQMKDGSTDYGGPYPLDAKQAYVLENATRDPDGLITCTTGSAFKINLGSAVQVGGFVKYRVVNE